MNDDGCIKLLLGLIAAQTAAAVAILAAVAKFIQIYRRTHPDGWHDSPRRKPKPPQPEED